jgi:hypothetical protein
MTTDGSIVGARAAIGEAAERYAAFLQLAPNVVWRR